MRGRDMRLGYRPDLEAITLSVFEWDPTGLSCKKTNWFLVILTCISMCYSELQRVQVSDSAVVACSYKVFKKSCYQSEPRL
jgi:hypothetical protein